MDTAACHDRAAEDGVLRRVIDGLRSQDSANSGGRRSMRRNAEASPSRSIRRAELSLAHPHRLLEHRLEHRLELAGERQMTLSTSAVAVCCCSDSVSSRVRACSSSNSRVFSIAMTAWSAKLVTSSICLSVNGRTSCAIDDDDADQLVVLEHRDDEHGAHAARSCDRAPTCTPDRPARRRYRHMDARFDGATRPDGAWAGVERIVAA